MATRSSLIAPSNSTDALFRAWIGEIDAALIQFGWTNTNAAGSINFSTVLKPAGANTIQGFAVYQMADALQATNPFFLKIEFGSAGVVNQPIIFVTIGTVHDGSGNLTGTQVSARQQINPTTDTTTTHNCDFSGDTARFVMGMWRTLGSGMWFSVERTRDTSGAYTGTGISYFLGNGSSVYKQGFVPSAAIGVPPVETTPLAALPTANPTTFNSDKAIGVPITFMGGGQAPGMNICFYRSNDFTAGTTYTATMYGASRTFMALGTNLGGMTLSGVAAYILMRYE